MYQNDLAEQQARAYNNTLSKQSHMSIDSSGQLGLGLGTHSTIIGAERSIRADNTIISMEVQNAVNGYVVRINRETFIAHTPTDISDLVLKRLAIHSLEKE